MSRSARCLRRSPWAAEVLEDRVLLTDGYLFQGIHDIEVVGRASDGNWWATGFGIPRPDVTFAADHELFARWNPAVDWRHVTFGDYDGDGLEDIAGWDPSSGYWWTSMADGVGSTTFLAGRWTNALAWSDVAAMDLAATGDRGVQGHFTRKADLVGRAANGQWWAAVSNGDGTFTNQLLTSWDPTAGWRDVNFVDVNNDGETDILGRTSTGQWWAAMNRGDLTFENVLVASWNESLGWKDVTNVHNFYGDGRDAILGRANDGTWFTLRFTAAGAIVAPVGKWNESVGWRNVTGISGQDEYRGAIAGRTPAGNWWVMYWDPATGKSVTKYGNGTDTEPADWSDAAGVRDVMPFWSEFHEIGGIVGRDAAGRWVVAFMSVGFGLYDMFAPSWTRASGGTGDPSGVATWSNATTWRDVAVANVTRSVVSAIHFNVESGGGMAPPHNSWLEIYIRGHRRGTTVTAEDFGADSRYWVKVTYAVPATGYTREFVIAHSMRTVFATSGLRWDIHFSGHNGVDNYTNRSTRPEGDRPGQPDRAIAHGWGGDDTLDGVNGVFDALFGGDGTDILLGDPGDQIVQDA